MFRMESLHIVHIRVLPWGDNSISVKENEIRINDCIGKGVLSFKNLRSPIPLFSNHKNLFKSNQYIPVSIP